MKEKLKYDAPLCDEYAVTLEKMITLSTSNPFADNDSDWSDAEEDTE